MNREKIIKILLLEKHPLLREALVSFINKEPWVNVCEDFGDRGEIIDSIKRFMPDIIIIDLSGISFPGLEFLAEIRNLYPGINIIVLSLYIDAFISNKFLKAGADCCMDIFDVVDELKGRIINIVNQERFPLF